MNFRGPRDTLATMGARLRTGIGGILAVLAFVGCGGGSADATATTVPDTAARQGAGTGPAAENPEEGTTLPDSEADDPLAALVPTPADGDPRRNGSTPKLAIQRCGAGESYAFVAAEFQCPGGGNPLGGDPRAGADARVGNVGAGPDGHVLDLYDVPCPNAAVRLYVDLYHCPPGRVPY